MFYTFQIGLTSLALAASLATTPIESAQSEEPPPATKVAVELTIEELIVEKSKENGVNPRVASAIAFCESTHRQYDASGNALRGKQNRQDVGLFQINERFHLEASKKLGHDIYTTEGNIDYAMHLLKTQGRKPWVWSKPCWEPKVA
jgi:hypothetical protein